MRSQLSSAESSSAPAPGKSDESRDTSRLAWWIPHWQHEWRLIKRLAPFLTGKQKYLGWIFISSGAVILTQLALPLLMKAAVDQGIMFGDFTTIVMYTVIFLVVTVLATVLRSQQAVLTTELVQHIIKNFRNHLIQHILWQKPAYHDSEASGNLLTRATHDFDSITEYLNHGVLRAMVDFFVVVGSLGALLLLHPALLGVGLCAFVVCVYGIRVISVRTRSQSYVSKRELSKLNAHTQECLYQQMAIKLYGGESYKFAEHAQLNRQFRRAHIKVVGYDAFLFSFIEGLTAVTIGVSFWLLASEFMGFDSLSPGVMVAFVRVVQQIFDPLKELGSTISMLQGLFANLDRINELLSVEAKLEGTQLLSMLQRPGAIQFKGVKFRYQQNQAVTAPEVTSPWIVEDISFEIPFGSSVAIVGETGSGKSTLMKLLAKIYDGYAGSITVGDHELSAICPHELRKQMALVSQDLTLFSGTMEWNIHLGRAGMSRQDAIRAAKTAGAHEFISAWDRGYDELVLESGVNLSHGQKQLISLCRALCYDPEILILDEATSAIDPVTEEALRHVFTQVIQHKTRIIIAHKLATIKECDQILVMDQGRLVEKGKHHDLMLKQGVYYGLIQARNQLAQHST